MGFSVIIPARYASTRLPAKPLMKIAGKSMIQRVHEKAVQSGAQQVIVATDDSRIAQAVQEFGGQVCMTSPEHSSGTERLAEVVNIMGIADEQIIVNIQGDEPLIPPAIISQVAENLEKNQVSMATLAAEIHDIKEVFNPNVVKVLTDKRGFALYFSRAAIPWDRESFAQQPQILNHSLLRHIGIYAYRAGFINTYVSWASTQLEKIECLEQLRVLWNGEKIHVAVAREVSPAGVDTAEDLAKVNEILNSESQN